jgi:hypothetical protein
MEDENEIAQLLREILAVLRDNNERIQANVAESRARADAARERTDKQLAELHRQVEATKKQTRSNLNRSLIAGALIALIVILMVVQAILRMG